MKKGYLMPHPPLIVEGVGDGTEIPATRGACEQIGREAKTGDADVAVIITPHSIMYSDYFHISPGHGASGDFKKFRCPQIGFNVEYDSELAEAIAGFAELDGIPAGFLGERDSALDHGTTVPLYFTQFKRIVRISLSGLGFIVQYRFGMCIQKAIDKLKRKAVIIASGDMSHKLGGSYGFSQYGVEHDLYVRESLENSDIYRLFSITPKVADNAEECGLRSLMIMCGVFDGLQAECEVLSYESPFGVGYLTAKISADAKAESLLPKLIAAKAAKIRATREMEDPFVKLARANIEHFTRTGQTIALPDDLPTEMMSEKAGVFVSIKKDGNLRGCIGTTAPTAGNIALEIINNGVSACSRDPRFDPVTPDELDDLTYSVDVLFPPEPIESKSLLDVKRYGVIVSCGYKRGLLLPNLDGVDSVDEQVSIALQKGGIKPTEKYSMERFEVVRHK